jgi:hypothetical protein
MESGIFSAAGLAAGVHIETAREIALFGASRFLPLGIPE